VVLPRLRPPERLLNRSIDPIAGPSLLSRGIRRALRFWRPTRQVRWGSLRSLEPVSRVFGFDRGVPIDRYYIEGFLKIHQTEIRGRVLEIGDPSYTRAFGAGRVTRSEVLHAEPGNSSATFVGDLSSGEGIPRNVYDCMILTQTLPFLYDVRAAVMSSFAALTPGGVLLATFPGISQISRYDMDHWGDFWRFTDASARRLFDDVFRAENVEVVTFGNVLAACALLQGLAAHELKRRELDWRDPDFQVIIGVRAVKRMPVS
jgi:hypothetical protein